MIRAILRSGPTGALVVAAALLAACAAPVQTESMVAPNVAVARKLPYSVDVRASGDAAVGGLSNEALKAAIEKSITQSGLFKSVVQGSDGDYELTVAIVNVNRPAFGASMTVSLEANWTLSKATDHSIAWHKSIHTTHTTGALEAFAGAERVRLAVEGATRDNIAQGLQAIGELNL